MTAFIPRGFYAIADVGARPDDDTGALAARVRSLVESAPCCVQVRAKALSDRQICETAQIVREVCRAGGVPFCINDRVDLALLVDADIVHVGQDDLPIDLVRKVVAAVGRKMVVGVSTHNLVQAQAAAVAGADYIAFGPVFGTASKARPDPVVGTQRLTEVVRAVSVPVVAIGGIDTGNIADVAATGVHAAAVISAVWGAADPAAAGRAIGAAFTETR